MTDQIILQIGRPSAAAVASVSSIAGQVDAVGTNIASVRAVGDDLLGPGHLIIISNDFTGPGHIAIVGNDLAGPGHIAFVAENASDAAALGAFIRGDASWPAYLTAAGNIAATQITGVLDPARIPASVKAAPVVAVNGGDEPSTIPNMTSALFTSIGTGTAVIDVDGVTHYYKGTGDKGDPASYVVGADVTPLWSQIDGKPTDRDGFGLTDVQTVAEADAKYAEYSELPSVAHINLVTPHVVPYASGQLRDTELAAAVAAAALDSKPIVIEPGCEFSQEVTLNGGERIELLGDINIDQIDGTLFSSTRATEVLGNVTVHAGGSAEVTLESGSTVPSVGDDVYFEYSTPYEFEKNFNRVVGVNGLVIELAGELRITYPGNPVMRRITYKDQVELDGYRCLISGANLPALSEFRLCHLEGLRRAIVAGFTLDSIDMGGNATAFGMVGTEYCDDVIFRDIMARDVHSNLQIFAAYRGRRASMENLQTEGGDNFGGIVCQNLDHLKLVGGSFDGRYGTPTVEESVRGTKFTSCGMVQSVGGLEIRGYDTAVRMDNCGQSMFDSIMAEDGNMGWQVVSSIDQPGEHQEGHLCGSLMTRRMKGYSLRSTEPGTVVNSMFCRDSEQGCVELLTSRGSGVGSFVSHNHGTQNAAFYAGYFGPDTFWHNAILTDENPSTKRGFQIKATTLQGGFRAVGTGANDGDPFLADVITTA